MLMTREDVKARLELGPVDANIDALYAEIKKAQQPSVITESTVLGSFRLQRERVEKLKAICDALRVGILLSIIIWTTSIIIVGAFVFVGRQEKRYEAQEVWVCMGHNLNACEAAVRTHDNAWDDEDEVGRAILLRTYWKQSTGRNLPLPVPSFEN